MLGGRTGDKRPILKLIKFDFVLSFLRRDGNTENVQGVCDTFRWDRNMTNTGEKNDRVLI